MRTSTILSVPVMAMCVLLAFLHRGLSLPLILAVLLFLRLVAEAARVWRTAGWTGLLPEDSAPAGRRPGWPRMELRMLLMTWMMLAALVILGAGFTMVVGEESAFACVTLAACVAAVGMVAAGHVVLRRRSAWARALGLLFLLL